MLKTYEAEQETEVILYDARLLRGALINLAKYTPWAYISHCLLYSDNGRFSIISEHLRSSSHAEAPAIPLPSATPSPELPPPLSYPLPPSDFSDKDRC